MRNGRQDTRAPFTAEKARELAEKAKTIVSMQSTNGQWIPSPLPFDLADFDLRSTPSPQMRTGRRRGYFAILQNHPSGLIVYYARPVERVNFLSAGTLFIFALILLVIFLCFRYVNSLLKPIEIVNSAAKQLYRGNFDAVVPIARENELGQLAATFNSMVMSIKQMLNAKHQLLVAVSHELRSPLARLRIACELMQDENYRADMINDIQLIEKIIAEIMQGEQLSEGHTSLKISIVSIKTLLASFMEELSGNERDLVQTGNDRDVQFFADPVRLKIAIRNLVRNALQHAQGIGNSVGLPDSGERNQPIRTHWTEDKKTVKISVTDQGQGFSSEDLQCIGKPFFKADRARQHHNGFGMGLYLCKLIAEAHGGSLEIKSETGNGAEVSIIVLKKQELNPTNPHS